MIHECWNQTSECNTCWDISHIVSASPKSASSGEHECISLDNKLASCRSTGAQGEIGVTGQRRTSVLPLPLTAVWRSSLTLTALLYQHTVSLWVCLLFHQSLLCCSTHNANVYEQSQWVALHSHVYSKYKSRREDQFLRADCRSSLYFG